MKLNQSLYMLGLLSLAVAVGMMPTLASSGQAASDASGRDMSGQQQMQSGEHRSMQADQQKMQSKMHSKMQSPSASGDAPIHISPAALKKIQEQLSEQGHKAGSSDGIWGGSTASALKAFQKEQGLAPTGKLDVETIQALKVEEVFSDESDMGQNGRMAGSGAQLYISPARLKEVQQSLKDQGYDPGQADGVWGRKTQEAISMYQKDKGMTPSGQITVGMLENMGMSQVVAAMGIEGGDMQEQMAAGQPSGEQDARGYFGDPSGQSMAGAGAPIFAGSDMIRQVEQALKDQGHDPGEVDGTWSSETAQAVKEFQQSQNLAPTGTLTVATIRKVMQPDQGGSDPGVSSQPSGQDMKGENPMNPGAQPQPPGTMPDKDVKVGQ
jgi:peptidoglycan hydrolase-like protein with peptidoglycan-binding domain